MGEGGFGLVTRCRNTETNEMVAVKVTKPDSSVFHQAREEIATLKKLRRLDPDSSNIVKWNGFFFDKERLCLNFELLDQSLLEYMIDRQEKRLNMAELRTIIQQLATAFSHLSSMKLIHADLKLDNIMIVDSRQQPLQVRLIDFGLAFPVSSAEQGDTVQTLWYRAPEVLLHAPYNEAIDMWSLGQVAANMATGSLLYQGDIDFDMLHCINHAQGLPPDHVLERGLLTSYFCQRQTNGPRRWTLKDPEIFEKETGHSTCISDPWLDSLDDIEGMTENDGGSQSDQRLFMDLLKRMLHLDPDQRIKPHEVLQHPFIAQKLPQRSGLRTDVKMDNDKLPHREQIQLSYFKEETPESHQIYQTSGPNSNPGNVNKASFIEEERRTFDEMPEELHISPARILGGFNIVKEKLGEGGFGVVHKCLNTRTNEVVAIKCIKEDFTAWARYEISILEKLRCLDPEICHIVKWNGFFSDADYICLSFELLDQSLGDYLDNRNSVGLTMTEVRPIINQLATALCYLSSLKLIHADIKPQNVMIRNPVQQPLKVKLIDFGLAHPVSRVDPSGRVGTRWYMAPEVILKSPYDEAIDMWSLGLVLVEMILGFPFYPGQTYYAMLHMINETQGLPPDHVLDHGLATSDHLNRQNCHRQHWTLKKPAQVRHETGEPIWHVMSPCVSCLDDLEHKIMTDGEDQTDRCLLKDLIKTMLHLDPDLRIKPLEVLQHPFFTPKLQKCSNPDTCTEIMDIQEMLGFDPQRKKKKKKKKKMKKEIQVSPGEYLATSSVRKKKQGGGHQMCPADKLVPPGQTLIPGGQVKLLNLN